MQGIVKKSYSIRWLFCLLYTRNFALFAQVDRTVIFQDPEEAIAILIDGMHWEEALRLVSSLSGIIREL